MHVRGTNMLIYGKTHTIELKVSINQKNIAESPLTKFINKESHPNSS